MEHGLHDKSREPARQNFCMACGMNFDKSILRHAEKVACKRAHPFAARSAEQASARPGSGHTEAVCELYVHARRVACYTYITDDMKDAVRMPMKGRSDPERRRQGHQKPRFRDRRTRTPCMHAGHD